MTPSILALTAAAAAGAVLALAVMVLILPKMMITTHQSPFGLDESVEVFERSIKENGWGHSGTIDLNESAAKRGRELTTRVKVVQLCHPDYAKEVLASDTYVSSLMPCRVSFWKGADGKTYYSKMNTGLMGKLFGGTIARVMGTSVARDEERMLRALGPGRA